MQRGEIESLIERALDGRITDAEALALEAALRARPDLAAELERKANVLVEDAKSPGLDRLLGDAGAGWRAAWPETSALQQRILDRAPRGRLMRMSWAVLASGAAAAAALFVFLALRPGVESSNHLSGVDPRPGSVAEEEPAATIRGRMHLDGGVIGFSAYDTYELGGAVADVDPGTLLRPGSGRIEQVGGYALYTVDANARLSVTIGQGRLDLTGPATAYADIEEADAAEEMLLLRHDYSGLFRAWLERKRHPDYAVCLLSGEGSLTVRAGAGPERLTINGEREVAGERPDAAAGEAHEHLRRQRDERLNIQIEHLFKQADGNGDGAISADERPALVEDFDANGDGRLTREEYADALRSRGEKRRVQRRQAVDRVAGFVDRAFGALDSDNDDRLSQHELRRNKAALGADANSDGYLTRGELAGALSTMAAREALRHELQRLMARGEDAPVRGDRPDKPDRTGKPDHPSRPNGLGSRPPQRPNGGHPSGNGR